MSENNKKTNGWKITAIIFIVLFIVETSIVIWAIDSAYETMDNENECIYNICEDAESYRFDEYYNVCECYTDNELVKSEYMK